MRGLTTALLAGIAYLVFKSRHRASTQQAPSGPPKPGIENAGTADHGSPPSAPEQPHAAFPSESRQQHPRANDQPGGNGHEWSRSEVIAAASAAATLAGAVFAAFAFFAALEAAREAGRQADIAQDNLLVSDRPWIKVEKVSVNKLTMINGAIIGFAEVSVKNFGHSPATNLFVRHEIKPFGNSQWGRDITATICKTAREKREASTIQVIFPDDGKPTGGNLGDEELVPMQLFVPPEDIASAKAARLENNFAQDKVSFGFEQAIKRKKEKETSAFQTTFTLAGCLTYFSYHGLIGQTGFVVYIYRRDNVDGRFTYDFATFDTGRSGDILTEEINVVNATLGGIDIR